MSEVAIVNAALSKLGEPPILALSQDTDAARTMNLRYQAVRDAELRRRRWRFAIKRVSLAALTAAPDSDYARQFQLPNDFLRIIEGADIVSSVNMTDFRGRSNALYQIEGRVILTDLGDPLAIRYIAQITDTATFDSAFTESLSSRLAYEVAKKITGSDAERDRCLEDYRQSIREATRANALELAPEDPSDDTWVMARTL